MKIENKILDINKQWDDLMSTKNEQFVSFMEDVQNKLLLNIVSVSNLKSSKEIKDQPGIYCFFLDDFPYSTDEYDKFCGDWDSNYNNNKKIKGLTRPTKIRFSSSQKRGSESGKVVFYIGKRRKLTSRISQHINHTASGTFGLKLSRKGALEFKNKMSFSYWYLPKEFNDLNTEFKDMLLSKIEHRLIDLWSPRVGKK